MQWLISIFVFIVALIIGVTLYLQPNDFIGCNEQPTGQAECGVADAIVVVSGGDTQARTQAGIDLYKAGWADSLVFSGAAYDTSGPSNAAAMMSQAQASGVPTSAISIDEKAINTQENAENTQSIFTAKGFDNVILVTSGYHQRRASLEFNKRAGDSVIIRDHPVAADDDWGFLWWTTPRGWWLAGGELVKIGAFYLGATS